MHLKTPAAPASQHPRRSVATFWRGLARACAGLLLAGVTGVAQPSNEPLVPALTTTSGAFTANFVADRNNLSIIELSGNYNENAADGSPNLEPRAVIAREFFRNHPDNYDMLVVFTGFPIVMEGDAVGFHHAVQNHVQGIGRPLFDNSSQYGSAGKLQGYIDMAALSGWQTDVLDAKFERVLQTFAHEFMHQFAAFVRYKKPDGTLSTGLLGQQQAHWGFLVDSDASIMYGARWRDNGNGTFDATAIREIYSPLDLYLAGLNAPNEVPPFFLIEAPGVDNTQTPIPNASVSGVRRDIHIEDIVAAEGPRVPDAAHAQKDFRLAFIYVVRPGQTVSSQEVAAINTVRREVGTRFNAMTHGRANANVFTEPAQSGAIGAPISPLPPNLPPTTAIDLTAGLKWLEQHQTPDGSWADTPATAPRDSAVALATLTSQDPGFAGVASGFAWLGGQAASANTDFLARGLRAALAAGYGAQTTAQLAELLGRQNADGGWGLGPGYGSDPLDSALALQALQLRATPDDAASRAGVAYLLSHQGADGGWGQIAAGTSRTVVTAIVMYTLRNEPSASAALTQGKAFLAARQGSDGGFGEAGSFIHDTALVLQTMIALNATSAIDAAKAIQYLSSAQRADGSWAGSVYATALALDAIARANAMNWAVASFTAAPGTTTDGQRVSLNATVKNTGNQPTPAGKVRFYDGDPTAGGTPIGADVDIPLLGPGGTAAALVSWNTLGKAGSHRLFVVVDPDHTGSELSLADNAASLSYTVNPPGGGIDLLVSDADLSVSPAHPTRIPSALTVSGLLTNAGDADAAAVHVVLWAGTGSAKAKAGETTVNLPARATWPVSFPVTLDTAGTTVYTVQIDPEGAVAETDRSNNQASISVSTTPGIDLEVLPADIVLDKPAARVGDDLNFKVSLHNRGTVDTTSVAVRYSILDGATESTILTNTVQLAAGQTIDQTIPWRAAKAGSFSFKVTLDPDSLVTETDEGNNIAQLDFSVAAANGPNLAVSYKDLTVAPNPALEGGTARITVLLRNTGTQAIDNAELAFYSGNPANQGVQIGATQVVPSLTAGQSQTVSIDWLVPDPAEKLIFAVADPANKIANEASKDDNQAFITVPVRALPDLAVAGGDVTLTPALPKPGDAVTLAVKVSNLGQQGAANVLVRLYDGDPAAGGVRIGGDQTIADLPAQTSATVSFAGTFPADAAQHTFYIYVDPDNAIAERYKANNKAALSATAQNADFAVSERYFSPNGDGVKDATTLSFRLKTPATVSIQVVNTDGTAVRHAQNPAWTSISGGQWTWDGLNDSGSLVRDDEYRIQVLDAGGALLGDALVVLDTNRAPLLDAVGTRFGIKTNLTCLIPQKLTFDLAAESYWRDGQPSSPQMVGVPDGSAYFFTITEQNTPDDLPIGVYKLNEWGIELQQIVPAADADPTVGVWTYVKPTVDGSRIALLKRQQGANTIWIATGEGRSLRPLELGSVTPPSPLYLVDFNSTGDELYFAASDGQDSKLHAKAVDQPSIVRNLGLIMSMPLFLSPDRRKAFGFLDGATSVILDLKTGGFAALPNIANPGPGSSIAWSPNGHYLAIFLNLSRTLVVFDENGQKLVDLANLASASMVSWAEDSNDLYFTTEDRCGADGGVCTQGLVRRLRLSTGEWSDMSRVEYQFPSKCGACELNAGGHVYQDVIPGRDQSRIDVFLGRAEFSGPWAHGNYSPLDSSATLENMPPYTQRSFSWPSSGGPTPESVFAQYGHALYYSKPWRSVDGGACYDHGGDGDWWAFHSLQNLTADLRTTRATGGSIIRLSGTAADLNFSRYVVEYSDVTRPGVWVPVAPASADPIVDGILGQWVPPAPGTYFVRLTVDDLAGNSRQVIKRVAWGDNALITDIYRTPLYISPNGDGVQDKALIHYRVVEPVNLEFAIYNGKGDRIRSFTRNQAVAGVEVNMEWDGRDDLGQVVPDGEYRLTVLGYEFPITVDSTPPAAHLPATSILTMIEPVTACDTGETGYFACAIPALKWDVIDANFSDATISSGFGIDPTSWETVQMSQFAQGFLSGKELTLWDYTLKRFRIQAKDKAGNTTTELAPSGVEQFELIGYENGAQRELFMDWFPLDRVNDAGYRSRAGFTVEIANTNDGLTLQLAETVRVPLVQVAVEYAYADGGSAEWSEVPITTFYPSIQPVASFSGWPDRNFNKRLDLNAGLLAPPDNLFLIHWKLDQLDRDGNYVFRVRALAGDGKIYYSRAFPIRKMPLLKITDASMDRAGYMNVAAVERIGKLVSSVDLVVSSIGDPYYATERVLGSVPGAPDIQGLGSFGFLVPGPFLACTQYSLQLRAHLVGGGELWSDPFDENQCDGIVADVQPVFSERCGKVPGGKLRITLTANPLAYKSGVPLKHLVFGRMRADGSDDIVFNVVDPVLGYPYSFDLDTSGLAEGTYQYFARTTDVDGNNWTTGVSVISDHIPVSARITYPVANQKVCGKPVTMADGSVMSGVFVEGELTDAGGFDYVLDYGAGTEPVKWGVLGAEEPDCFTAFNREPGSNPGSVRNCPLSTLNGHRVAGPLGVPITGVTGDVTARVIARDWGGYQVCEQVSFSVDTEVDANEIVLDRKLFSPGTASQLGDVTVTYAAGEALTVNAEVYRREDVTFADSGKIAGFLAAPLRTIARKAALGAGPGGITWDGKDDSGSYAADGAYVLVLRFQDGCTNEKLRVFDVEVDRTPPQLAIAYPGVGDALGGMVEVLGSAADKHFMGYLLEIGAGTSPLGWMPLDGGQQQVDYGLLARWNTHGQIGTYTLRLSSTDAAGNSAEAHVTLTLATQTDLLVAFDAQPSLFSPNGDGRLDQTNLRFELTDPAKISLGVYRGNTLVRTLIGAQLFSLGPETLSWDGADDTGNLLPEQDYRVTIEAISSADASVRQVESTTVAIDRTPPVIQLTHPSGGYVRGTDGVTGSVTDPHLSDYSVTIQGLDPESASTLMDTGADQRVGYRFADLKNFAEGVYRLKITADDKAANHSELSSRFEIDNTPPKVAISVPVTGAVVGANGGPLGITGSIDERNLKQYALNLGQGAPPVYPANPLESGTTLPLASPLHTLDLAQLADGPYTVRLTALDKAGWTGEADAAIIVDNTPPTAIIKLPADGAYVRAPGDIVGTAADANFSQYILETAPGAKTQATRWTQFAAGTEAVADGPLARLTALPPDGVQSLRLTVTDKAGNVSVALSQVVVDTTPPALPIDLTATVQNRQDVLLKWTANTEPDLAGYAVYRDGTRLNTDLVPDATYTDVGVAEGKHSYHVTAFDKAGNESQPSNTVSVTISLGALMAQISAPAKGGRVSALVDIKGTAYSVRDFKEYRVFIGEGAAPSAYSLLRRSPVATQSDLLAQWNTIGLPENAKYTIRLEAEDTFGNLASDSATVTTDNLPPAKPVLRAAAAGNDVTLTWDANTEPDMDGYLLYRDGRLVNATGTVVGSLTPYLIHDLTYLDKGVSDGVHVYTLVAVDLAGNQSEPSDPAQVTIDTRAPHATIVQPADGTKIDHTTYVLATCPDTDVATVRFQYKAASASTWTDIDPVSTKTPYYVNWNPQGLAYGDYNLRAVATDLTGHVDPAPDAITVTYTVLDRPLPPGSLKTHVNGGDVTLTWTASASTATVGYHIDRIDPAGTATRITATPVPALTDVDLGVADGKYTYKVYAVDGYGNVSDAVGPAPALVFTPLLKQPYTPTASLSTTLNGSGQASLTTQVRRTNGAQSDVVATVNADAQGKFSADVGLLLGDNRFSVIQQDSEGNTSKPAGVHVVAGTPPSAPTGLAGTATGLDVALSWNANPEANLAGYFVGVDGVANAVPAVIASAQASSVGYPASMAIDGNPDTAWYPAGPIADTGPQTFELVLAQPAMLQRLDVTWTPWGDRYGAKDFDLEAWDGEVWVPLAEVRGNDQASTAVTLAQPYLSDRLRLVLISERDPALGLAIAELSLQRLDTTQATAATQTVTNGNRQFTVSAYNTLGLVSVPSPVKVGVGDTEAPLPVVLQGEVQGADIHLSWTASASPDVASYDVLRDGVFWLNHTDLATLAEIDPSKPNGTYRYQVIAIDASGNRSPPSNEVSLDVNLTAPGQAIGLTVTVPSIGGALDLAWSAPSGGTAPAAYRVLRGLTAGGPYQLVSTPAPVVDTHYRDTGLTNGTRYFYRVQALDAYGNAGTQSNEDSGIPQDTAGPLAPVLVYPAIAGVPATVWTAYVPVMGFAEPGATVSLTVGGFAAGSAQAAPADETVDVPASGDVITLSPDGSRLAVGGQGQIRLFGFTRSGSGDVASLAQTLVYNTAGRLAWSPQGQYLAFVDAVHNAATNNDTNVLRYLSVSDGQVHTLNAVVPDAWSVAWAGSGTELFVVGTATDGTGITGLWSVSLATGTASLLFDSAGASIWGVAAAPDGNSIAYARNGQLEILDLGSKNTTVAPGATDVGNPIWSYDGKSLLYEAYSAGPTRIARYDLGAAAPTDVTDGTQQCYQPAWSPDGKHIAYVADAIHVRDLATGNETVSGSPVGSLEWVKSGYLVYSPTPDHTLRVRPAGHFKIPTVGLVPGENNLIARAVDGAGNVGPESAPALVIYSTAGRPDLAVASADIVPLPSLPTVADKTRITVTVHNIGTQASPASDLTIVLADAAKRLTTLYQGPIGALAPGGSQSVFVDWVPTAAGTYDLIATVDRLGTVDEISESNNVAVREFQVLDSATQTLTVATDAQEYQPGQNVTVTAVVTNGNGAFSGTLEMAIEDAQGYVVQTLPAAPLNALPYGASATRTFTWNTGATLGGAYRAHGRLKDATGALVTDAAADFAIVAPISVTATVNTDRAEYGANSAVAILGSIAANAPAQGMAAKARFRVVQGGTVLFEEIQDTVLGPYVDVVSHWNTGTTPAGDFSAVLDVIADGTVVATATSAFRIVPGSLDTIHLSGKLTLSRTRLLVGDTLTVDALVKSDSNVAILHLPVTIRVRDPATGATLDSYQSTVDLAAGGSAPLRAVFAATGWPLKTLAVRLEADLGAAAIDKSGTLASSPTLLDQQDVSLYAEDTPLADILAPADKTYLKTLGTLLGTAHAPAAHIVGTEYRIDANDWQPLPGGESPTGQYTTPLPAVPDGAHGVEFRATDQFGNVSPAAHVDVTVDSIPPVIVVDGAAQGGSYAPGVAPLVTVTDLHLSTSTITLDGAPYLSGTPIAATGGHVIAVAADDLAGNQSQLTVSFTVAITASGSVTAAILSPKDKALLRAPGTLLGSAESTAGHVTATEYRVDGAAWVAIGGGETASHQYAVALPAVADGPHSLEFRATDQLGNVSPAARVDIVIDSIPPLITIGRVVNGGRHDPGVAPTVTATDLHLSTVTITLDGAPYLSGTPITALGEHLLDVVADDLAGNRSHSMTVFAVGTASGLIRTVPANRVPLPLIPLLLVFVWLAWRPVHTHIKNRRQ